MIEQKGVEFSISYQGRKITHLANLKAINLIHCISDLSIDKCEDNARPLVARLNLIVEELENVFIEIAAKPVFEILRKLTSSYGMLVITLLKRIEAIEQTNRQEQQIYLAAIDRKLKAVKGISVNSQEDKIDSTRFSTKLQRKSMGGIALYNQYHRRHIESTKVTKTYASLKECEQAFIRSVQEQKAKNQIESLLEPYPNNEVYKELQPKECLTSQTSYSIAAQLERHISIVNVTCEETNVLLANCQQRTDQFTAEMGYRADFELAVDSCKQDFRQTTEKCNQKLREILSNYNNIKNSLEKSLYSVRHQYQELKKNTIDKERTESEVQTDPIKTTVDRNELIALMMQHGLLLPSQGLQAAEEKIKPQKSRKSFLNFAFEETARKISRCSVILAKNKQFESLKMENILTAQQTEELKYFLEEDSLAANKLNNNRQIIVSTILKQITARKESADASEANIESTSSEDENQKASGYRVKKNNTSQARISARGSLFGTIDVSEEEMSLPVLNTRRQDSIFDNELLEDYNQDNSFSNSEEQVSQIEITKNQTKRRAFKKVKELEKQRKDFNKERMLNQGHKNILEAKLTRQSFLSSQAESQDRSKLSVEKIKKNEEKKVNSLHRRNRSSERLNIIGGSNRSRTGLSSSRRNSNLSELASPQSQHNSIERQIQQELQNLQTSGAPKSPRCNSDYLYSIKQKPTTLKKTASPRKSPNSSDRSNQQRNSVGRQVLDILSENKKTRRNVKGQLLNRTYRLERKSNPKSIVNLDNTIETIHQVPEPLQAESTEAAKKCQNLEQYRKVLIRLHEPVCGANCPHLMRYLCNFIKYKGAAAKVRGGNIMKLNIENINGLGDPEPRDLKRVERHPLKASTSRVN